MRLPFRFLAIAAALHATAATACPPPPPPPLPPEPPARMEAETQEDYVLRLKEWEARMAEFERRRQFDIELRDARLEAQKQAVESTLWHASDQIVIATIVATGETAMRDDWGHVYAQSPQATLRIEDRIGGSGRARDLVLEYTGMTSCGPIGPLEVLAGKVGDSFVMFFRHGRPEVDRMLGAYPLDDTRRNWFAFQKSSRS